MVSCLENKVDTPRKVAAFVSCSLMSVLLQLPLSALERSIRFEHLSIEEGLSQNTVHSIVQDEVGFLWLGTQDGLNRWDGYEFEIYKHDPEDPSSLPEGSISALVSDPSGDLWVGTEGGGLARWHHEEDTFTRYTHDPMDEASLSGNQVRAIATTENDGLWVGTFAAGLNLLDSTTGTFTRFRNDLSVPGSLSDDRVRALSVDQRGDLWVGTFAGLDRYDRADGSFVHHFGPGESSGDTRVRSVVEDSDGWLWVGTLEGGLIRLDSRGSAFTRFVHDAGDPRSLSSNRVRSVFVDADDRLWAGTENGLDLFEPATETFANYRHNVADPASLSASRVVSLYEDRGGVMWVGTQGGGVNHWNSVGWSFGYYRLDAINAPGLSSNAIMAFSEDLAGDLWIGTLGGGLNHWDRRTGEINHFRHDPADPGGLSDDRVMALLHDHEGTLWVSNLAEGLSRFNAATQRFVHYRHDPDDPTSLAADGVMDIFEDSGGRLWLGTFGGGLSRFVAESETFVNFRYSEDDPRSLSDDRAGSLAEDATGVLWIGTHGGGLNRFDPASSSFTRFRHDEANGSSLSTDRIYSLYAETDGALWVGTAGGGLSKLELLSAEPENAVFRTYTDRDGLPSATINGIQADNEGLLWLSTNRGLSRFDPFTETFANYDTVDGLQSLEFNVGAHHESQSGELFFGGFDGFNAFFPAEIETNQYAPAIVVTAAATGGGRIDLPASGQFALGYRDAHLALEVSALDFTAPARNRYAYKLEGRGDEWVDLGHSRTVTVAGLDPGRYEVRIRGSNNEGVWSEESVDLDVEVEPPPWRSVPAYSLYFLLLGCGSLSYIHTQSKKTRRQQERARGLERTVEVTEENLQAERQRATKLESLGILAGGIAHDFNNMLMGISGNLQLARLELTNPAELDIYLKEADDGTRRASGLAGQLLTFAKGGSPVKSTARIEPVIREAARLSLAGSKAGYVFVVEDSDLRAHVDVGQLSQVINNLVINADQAMPDGGQIEIRIEAMTVAADEVPPLTAGSYVRILVSDTGHGIPADDLQQVFDPYFTTKTGGSGLGLATSYSIVKNHGGVLRVHSEKDRGATFEILLPIAAGRSAAAPELGEERGVAPTCGRVLLMDDDQIVLRSVEKMLKTLGYEVRTAIDGKKAIAAFERAQRSDRRFDLVVLDLTVRGGMGGCEVLVKLKEIDPSVKAMVCSGYSDDPVLANPEQYGFCAVLPKPFRLEELGRILYRIKHVDEKFAVGTSGTLESSRADQGQNVH